MTKNDLAARDLYRRHGAAWLIERANPRDTEALFDLVRRYVGRGDTVLDVCCGYGRLLLPLLREGIDVFGVDISETLLDEARDLLAAAGGFGHRIVAGNMKGLPVAGDRIDVAFCVWASFNFLVSEDEQVQALRELHRVLKRGGTALIECPVHEDRAPVRTVDVDGVRYQYYALTIREMRRLTASSPFATSTVTTEAVAGRNRMIAVLRK
jgi:ubiquinone/menaquinone biosynthesis C-methylase UbiE